MKLIVLTGSSRGLGNALYKELIDRDGIKVICISKNITEEQSDLLNTERDNFDFISADFSESDDPGFEKKIENGLQLKIAADEYTEVVFINNSGVIEPIGNIGHLDSREILMSMNINFLAPMLISQVLMRIIENMSIRLSIVNISSGAARNPISGWAIYCATKSAIMMFFDVVSKKQECKVVHVDPGVLNTDMQGVIREASSKDFPQVDAFKDLKNQGKLSDPALIAKDIVKKNVLV